MLYYLKTLNKQKGKFNVIYMEMYVYKIYKYNLWYLLAIKFSTLF